MRDIHIRVDMDKSKVSRATSRLEEAGLVTKVSDERDRRLVALSLTEAGRALTDRFGKIAGEFQAELMRDLGPDTAGLEAGLARFLGRDGRDEIV